MSPVKTHISIIMDMYSTRENSRASEQNRQTMIKDLQAFITISDT